MPNSPWVPQPDGTMQPSRELLDAVRANPDKYPTAVEDFAKLSGKSPEEVRQIIANEPSWTDWVFGNPILTDLREGVMEAGNTAAGKIAEAAEWVGADGAAENLREGLAVTEGLQQSLDPKFESEKGVVENVSEVAGQMVPALGAGLATGGLATGALVGGVVGHLTFEDEDNIVELINDWNPDIVPDFMVIQPEDGTATRQLKSLANNVIVEAAALGAGKVIARVYKGLKAGDAEAIQKAADELGVTADETVDTSQAAAEAVEETVRAGKIARQEGAAIAEAEAKALNKASLEAEEALAPLRHQPAGEDFIRFSDEAMGPVRTTIARDAETNVGRREELKAYLDGPEMQKMHAQTRAVYAAVAEDDLVRALKLIKDADVDKHYYGLWANAQIRAVNARVNARYLDLVQKLRDDPTLTTRAAFKAVSRRVMEAKLDLAELDRALGSNASYQLLQRKLTPGSGLALDDEGVRSVLDKLGDELVEHQRKWGYTIKSDKAEFVSAKLALAEERGIDSTQIIRYVEELWDDFSKAREGELAAMKTNRMSRLSAAEKAKLEASFVKVIHDLHTSALLGQLSTTGLEAMSNALQNIMLPFAHILGAKSFKALGPGSKAMVREYVGYAASMKIAAKNFGKTLWGGRGVVDDIDVMDAAHASKLDYQTMLDKGQYGRYLATRLWKGASDLSMATSEGFKTMRGFGLAWTDGYTQAIAAGMGKVDAKKAAMAYAQRMFDEKGALLDPHLKLQVARSSWQSKIDGRYATGKVAQAIENYRNSDNPVASTLARAAVPFFRTLVNIGGDAGQFVMPPASAIKALEKVPGLNKFTGAARFIDDLTGNNGFIVQKQAMARQRIGMIAMGMAATAVMSGKVRVTAPGGYKSWDAKQAQWETLPGSSLIVGNTAVDLTRFLPFSAPLLWAGIMGEQMEIEKNELDGGSLGIVDEADLAIVGATTYGYLMLNLLSDAGATRGLAEFFGAFSEAYETGDLTSLRRFGDNYVKQYTPGIVKMVGKRGEKDMLAGEDLISNVAAAAGFDVGSTYKRLDFLGKPVKTPWLQGFDPTYSKRVKVNEDILYREYAEMSLKADFAIKLDKPNRVFDKAFWRNMGVDVGNSWFDKTPSLNKLKVKDGRNAYDAYRSLVYNGKATSDQEVSTTSVGDRYGLGAKLLIRKGDNLETTLRKYVESPWYQNLNPDGREKVWKSIFGFYKKAAKGYVEANTVVTPDIFENSRYGSPIAGPATIGETKKAAGGLAQRAQTTSGYKDLLDQRFSTDQ